MFSNFKMRGKKASSETPQKQKIITWGMIVMTLILLTIIIGYLIHNLKIDRTYRWAIEDIAPKELSKKAKEDLKTETTKKEVPQKDKRVAEKSALVASVAKIKITPSLNEDDDKMSNLSKTSDPMKLPKQKIVIYFQFNSNELSEQAYEDLDEIARFLTKYPDSELIVEGYTDALGNKAYNKKLSEFRAVIIKNYLVSKGIDPLKISPVGLGAQDFVATNDTEQGRRLNRRVEIKINTK